jgi:hypothetical protein
MISKRQKIVIGSIGSLLLVFIAVLLIFGGWERKIVGKYRLEQFEDLETYYLHKAGQDDSADGGSIIGGTVRRIGWSSRYIVAERHSIYRGDADGWMIIDVESGKMSGPFTEADFQSRPESKDIQIYDASVAWKRLPGL